MTETFDDSTRKNIPFLSSLSKQGTLFTQFYNKGTTRTMEGYSAILMGQYYDKVTVDMSFKDPSMFHVFVDQKKLPLSKAQAVLSKKKLKIFADAGYPNYLPLRFYAGLSGKDASDDQTLEKAIQILEQDSPSLFLVGFKQPDKMCHTSSFEECVRQIRKIDERIGRLWKTIQQMPSYRGKTTLIVTNDHGRHTNNFNQHGDDCLGCQSLFLLVVGPDIKKNFQAKQIGELIDIAPSVAELLDFNFPFSEGKVLKEMFINMN